MPTDDLFLRLLSPDPGEAERRYAALRAKLIFFFVQRGCRDPQDWADEVVYRVSKALREGTELTTDLAGFCHGFAVNILKEARKRHARSAKNDPIESDIPAGISRPPHELAAIESMVLLREILEMLDAEDRDLLIRYHTEDRKALARELGITEENLRLRIFRIRRKLEILRARGSENSAGA
jgi:DNA-directed RNA polymerase specialized sigma24 family protein